MPEFDLTLDDFLRGAPGAYDGIDGELIPAHHYHAHPAWSRSQLVKALHSTPKHAKHDRENPPEGADALLCGEAIHVATLEPDVFERDWIYPPETVYLASGAGKADWLDWLADEAGYDFDVDEWTKPRKKGDEPQPKAYTLHRRAESKRVVGLDPRDGSFYPSHASIVAGVQRAMLESPKIQEVLGGGCGVRESTYLLEINGLLVRVRIDAGNYREDGIILLDLKSARDANPHRYRYVIERDHLDMQGGVYSHVVEEVTGVPVLGFYFVVFEKTPPYACSLVHLSDERRAEGLGQAMAAIERVRECQETGNWWDWSSNPNGGVVTV